MAIEFSYFRNKSFNLSKREIKYLKDEAVKRANWHTPIPEIIKATTEKLISGYPVYDRKPLQSDDFKQTGNITLIGDAAHPMSPFKGQGANQALLDALTIKKKFGSFAKLKIAICGDILHSRVAKSNIEILSTLGAKINIIGPKTLIPKDIQQPNIKIYNNMKAGLKNCDIVMMLRIQKERIVGKHITNEKEYFNKFGLDYKKLGYAKKQAFVMHPGPMNRGVEIDSKLADDVTRSLIQEQVSMGVAIRMACLEILINNKKYYVRKSIISISLWRSTIAWNSALVRITAFSFEKTLFEIGFF